MSKRRRGHTALCSDVGDMLEQNGGIEGEGRVVGF
jgi:hypothetical protein